jgi:hypothetical protein
MRGGYCFLSGVAGVTGCDPPVDFGPGVTPALLSVEPLESLAAVVLVFGLAPLVGPLPASFVDVVPLVGPLPASPFGCANTGADRPRAIAEMSKLLPNEDMATSLCKISPSQLDWNVPSSALPASFCEFDGRRGSPATRAFLQAIHRAPKNLGAPCSPASC